MAKAKKKKTVKKEVKKTLKGAMKELDEAITGFRPGFRSERYTALSSAVIVKFEEEPVSAIQELLIKHDGKDRFIEIIRVFFDYNTVFLRCIGKDFCSGHLDVIYYGAHGPKLKLRFGVQLDSYEHPLLADDFIVEEFIRFKINNFTEIRYSDDGKEIIETHDEIKEMFNATCKAVEGAREPRNKTSRTMKSRTERKKKSADKHK